MPTGYPGTGKYAGSKKKKKAGSKKSTAKKVEMPTSVEVSAEKLPQKPKTVIKEPKLTPEQQWNKDFDNAVMAVEATTGRMMMPHQVLRFSALYREIMTNS